MNRVSLLEKSKEELIDIIHHMANIIESQKNAFNTLCINDLAPNLQANERHQKNKETWANKKQILSRLLAKSQQYLEKDSELYNEIEYQLNILEDETYGNFSRSKRKKLLKKLIKSDD